MNIADLRAEFEVPDGSLRQIAGDFAASMDRGLQGEPSSLKMLSSFLDVPCGNETGRFLALDFGGTNVRCLDIELKGAGLWQVHNAVAKPLRDSAGTYDLTGASTGAAELFDFIASIIEQTAASQIAYLLGHTFSYPCRQLSVREAVLLSWTKELQMSGVVGNPVNQLLRAALQRHGLYRIEPAAILNDTVGTLLTAGFLDSTYDIGSICGTGHNTCYREAGGGRPVIINMESGNFSLLPQSAIDRQLDERSERPGEQRLEKMVGGRYLGEIVLTVLRERAGGMPPDAAIDTAWLALVLAGGSSGREAAIKLLDRLELDAGAANIDILQAAADVVVRRAARLAAACYFGVLIHMDPRLRQAHKIAIDGSLYEKLPAFAANIAAALAALLENSGATVPIRLVPGGSAIGAALAAAQGGPPQSDFSRRTI